MLQNTNNPYSRVNYLTFYYFCSKNEDVMTILYLVRHGETVDNANHIMQGQTPGELNEKGVQQAKELAEQLKDEPIDCFCVKRLTAKYPYL